MKTRIKQMICMVVIAAMVCTYALATTNTRAVLKDPEISPNQMGNFLAGQVSKKDSKTGKMKKTETVYAELNGDGSAKKTTVSDIITVKGNEPIEDVSILDNIKNLKGDEKFTKKDGKLVWENKGKDITYQGTTKVEPPISVDISYSLDGKDISAEELEGQSGELQIQYKFKNNAKAKGHDFVPFVVLGGFMLDDETFGNVKIDHGKVADYGDSKIVLGYSVPGLDDYLDNTFKDAQEYLNKIGLPDSFTISADVANCTMSMGLIVATSNLGNFNIKDSIDLSNIKSKINQLQNGADQLVDGANQLSDGTDKLAGASPKIKNGTSDLANGLKKVKKGTKKNYKGNKKFHKELNKGLKTAKSGAKKLADGTDSLAKGAKKVKNGAKDLDKGAGDINSGTKDLSGGIEQILYGFQKDGGINDGSKALKDGTKEANTGVNKLINMLQATPDSLDQQISQIMTQVKQASGGAITTEAQLAALINGINSAVEGGTPLETVLAAKGLNASTYYKLVQANDSVQTLESVKSSLENTIASHAKEIKDLKDGMQSLEDGSSDLKEGLYKVYTALYTLNYGASKLKDGTDKLKTGTGELAKGTSSLSDGATALNDGFIKLYDGVKVMTIKIGAASPQLVSGASKLDQAIAKVYAGSNKLANGTATFCNGIDTLADGTKKLRDGAQKLNNEGIKRITSLFGGKGEKAVEKIQDLLDAGNAYKAFSGISNKMDGQVKFIYKTPEIGEKE
ncbi:MAG: hypothetical protein IJ889_06675 [Eubacterium sp.]|nr:hypothetical protein [Eubacterium sp.]